MDDETRNRWILRLFLALVATVVLLKFAPRLAETIGFDTSEPLELITLPPTLQTLRELDAAQNWTTLPETVVIGGTVYNCEPYLDSVLTNIQKIGTLFSNYVVVIAIDEGSDGSLNRLRYWQSQLPRLVILPGKRSSPVRTTNIAHARNRILEFIRSMTDSVPMTYFVMMDCDDVCAAPIHLPVLQHVLLRSSEWEAVTFPGVNDYYDTWALSCAPFLLSYRHFVARRYTPPHERALTRTKNFIYKKLAQQEWIPCQSSFGGFAVYKIHPFLQCSYDNSFTRNLRFWTPKEIQANERACGSRLVHEQDEDCEHRFFNLSGVLRHRARMFIVPFALFRASTVP